MSKPKDPKAPHSKPTDKSDVRGSLKSIADALRTKRRKDPVKQSLLSKGFDVSKEVKKRNKSYRYRYPTRLQQINDARAEAVRSKRLSNPELKAINDETIKVAQERVEQQRKERLRQMEYERFTKRSSNSFNAFRGGYSMQPEETIEVVPNRHHSPPKFKNKIEEEIYRLTKKK